MDAVFWVSLLSILIAPLHAASNASTTSLLSATPKPPCRISRETIAGKPRFLPSFGPPVQPLTGTTYPVQSQTGTAYPVSSYIDAAYPTYPAYPTVKSYPERATYQAHREHSASFGQESDVFGHVAGFEAQLPGHNVETHHGVHRFTQGFGSAWNVPPPPLPPVILPPPPPPTSEGRQFHSVVNYGSINIHHGAHFEPHHNAKEPKEPPGGTGVVDMLPIKSTKPENEPETPTEKSRKLMVSTDGKGEEAEETEVEEIDKKL